MSHVHIIGGGLAGLSAAVELAAQAQVTLYEAGPACGGRARSFHDRTLDTRIDNGNHLLLSANALTFRYLDLIGSRHTLTGPGIPIFPYYDLADDLAWTLKLSRGKLPFWALPGGRRVPGMRISELSALGRLLRAGDNAVVQDCLRPGQLSRRLLEPFAISVLNTDLQTGSAKLLGNVVRQSLAQGEWPAVRGSPRSACQKHWLIPLLSIWRDTTPVSAQACVSAPSNAKAGVS